MIIFSSAYIQHVVLFGSKDQVVLCYCTLLYQACSQPLDLQRSYHGQRSYVITWVSNSQKEALCLLEAVRLGVGRIIGVNNVDIDDAERQCRRQPSLTCST